MLAFAAKNGVKSCLVSCISWFFSLLGSGVSVGVGRLDAVVETRKEQMP